MTMYLLLAIIPIAVRGIIGVYYIGRPGAVERRDKAFLWVVGIMLFCMIALRSYSVGSNDSKNYYDVWHTLSRASWRQLGIVIDKSPMEAGYLATVWALSHVFRNPQFVFVCSGLFFTVSICGFIYKNSMDHMLSFVMYVSLGLYTFMVQGLRQAVAIGICLMAIEFCKQRKPWKFILLVVLAMVFHQTAVVFFPVYFLYNLKINQKTLFWTAVIIVLLQIFAEPISGFGNRMFNRDYSRQVDGGGFVATAIYFLILLAVLLFTGKYKKEKDMSFFFYFTCAGMAIYLMRYFGIGVAERISFYFLAGQFVLLPNAIARASRGNQRILRAAATILCVLLFAYRLNGSNLVPYQFFWQ